MSATTNISRRTVLRGLGTAMALPLLESMLPRTAWGSLAIEAKPPVRMAFLFVPNGMNMEQWTPSSESSELELSPTLEPLQKFKSEMNVLSGLTLNGGRALGDGPGDHARCVASFLTGAHPYKTDGKEIKNGVSVDQAAAEKIGELTRLPSLELGLERSAQAGRCDSGYSCVYTSNMSWRSPTSPVAKEINPAALFDRLFGNGDPQQQGQSREKRERYRKSVLDFVLQDANDLRTRLGAVDRKKLDEYLFAVRDIERRIAAADKLTSSEDDASDYPRPLGVPHQFDQHAKLMFDLMALALQTDSTRTISFMLTNAGSNRSYPDIGVKEAHHHLSHHGNDKEKLEKIAKINRHHVELLAYLLDRLSSVKEGQGTLLDNCMIMYGSGLADGQRHQHHALPIALLGRGGGSIATGRHITFAKETPLTNLYLSMLDRVGAKVDALGDSTGRLEQLAG